MRDRKANEKELKNGVFGIIGHRREEVRRSAALGSDAALIDCGAVLAHTDPITGRCADIGSLAINVAANDVAAAGGEPVAFLLTVILPTTSTEDDLKKIMASAEAECVKLNAEIAGGHSEFSSAVTRPVVNAVAIAREIKGFTPRKIAPGDDILVTKTAALETTVLLAERGKVPLTAEEERAVDDMRRNLSVINDCRAVAGSVTNAYMHDVTEGGVENAVWETVTGAGLGAVIYTDEIPVDSVTEKLCSAFGVDPLRSLSSGRLLIVAENGEKLVSELKEKGVAASVIGKVTESGVYAENGSGERREISAVPDELLAMED